MTKGTSHTTVPTEKGFLVIHKKGDTGASRILKVTLLTNAHYMTDLKIIADTESEISKRLTGADCLTMSGVFLCISTAFSHDREYAVRFTKSGNASVLVNLRAYSLDMSPEEIAEIVLQNVERVRAAFDKGYPMVNEAVTLPVSYF